ncbi:hypothetical protein OTB20_25305 [Streptomyces sp. H27-H1]|uniref:2'-5' RNA ligase family protein n=1 Tax=unclassified Streptomyces TaxID=2593676 RepID=UPI002270641F|nr:MULTISPECIES: 2'-5' RNA ligase family protein [unclassified Streptomyces]MCY0929457.1 hypothetical protein [Streptomyces sp. H27-H1]MCY0938327.1 hypothetical protein [Streptomyces sp. H34-S4]
MRAYNSGFDRPGLTGVGAEGMHCTLLHTIGLALADVDLGALLKDAAEYAQTVQPFTLTFDRPTIGNVAVEMSGWPGGPFTQLVDDITRIMDRTGASFRPAPSRYPHMSVAYTSEGAESIEAVSLKAELAAINRTLSGTVHVDRLHLVEQWHDGAKIMWHPVAAVPLAGVTL